MKPSRKRLRGDQQPVGRRRGQRGGDLVLGGAFQRLARGRSPSSPVSSPRSAFCSDSWKLRPIAITSPTDFIAVESSGSAPLNFSKAKRGILVTT